MYVVTSRLVRLLDNQIIPDKRNSHTKDSVRHRAELCPQGKCTCRSEGAYLLQHHVGEITHLQKQHAFILNSTNGNLIRTSLPFLRSYRERFRQRLCWWYITTFAITCSQRVQFERDLKLTRFRDLATGCAMHVFSVEMIYSRSRCWFILVSP